MSKYVTLIEIGKKQKYIFKSNVMMESIGASIIIKNATEKDARQFYEKFNPSIIYEGGGNALYVFSQKEDGIEFAKAYSKFLYETYPGITLYLVGYELKEKESVKDGINTCYGLLAKKKNSKRNVETQIDFGKTVRCSSTNLPANVWVKDNNPTLKMPPERRRDYSLEVLTKCKNAQDERDVFKFLLPENTEYTFPKMFDSLGRNLGEKSYVAVTHIDGNQMGEKITRFNLSHEMKSGESLEEFDKRYIKDLGDFSRNIRELYESAVKETIDSLIKNMSQLREKLDLKGNELPIRPLILAGDDICFVSDGRIGVELCRICIENIKKKEIEGLKLNACGGVAIVKAHYPFSRAYDLAEELCQNAKNCIKNGDPDASYIDWHVDQAELDKGLSGIRKDYVSSDGSILNLRPYLVGEDSKVNSMANFLDAISVVSHSGNIARSSVKGMRESLRKGVSATTYYLKSRKDSDKAILKLGGSNNLVSDNGFIEVDGVNRSIFYDAIEMMDVYIKLED